MMRFSGVAVVLLASVAGAHLALSDELGFAAPGRAPGSGPQLVAAERPMSIFNDQVRRFRFRLEETLVTVETAEAFMLYHKARNQPEIIGAYPDSKTNSLVVVGPPEAEHAVRLTLANWIVARQGVSPPPLEVQHRALRFQRKELLRELAGLEIQLVAEDGERAEQIRSRIEAFEGELNVVERQIQVVNRYVQRLEGEE